MCFLNRWIDFVEQPAGSRGERRPSGDATLYLKPTCLGQAMCVVGSLAHPTSSAIKPPIIAEVVRRSHESAGEAQSGEFTRSPAGPSSDLADPGSVQAA
jgi:hypothetical protein